MKTTTLTIVWDDEPTKRALIHTLCGVNRNQPNTRQYPMFIQPQYRFKPEGEEVLVFGTLVCLELRAMERIVHLYEQYGIRYVAVRTADTKQDTYHSFVDRLTLLCPDIKIFDPEVGGLILDEIKLEIGDA